MTEEQTKQLKNAFKSAVAISYADTQDNHSTCASFHIQPFKTDWDEETVKDVMYQVQLYTKTWIVYPMEQALGIKAKDIDDEMLLKWHENQVLILKDRLNRKGI